MSVDWPQIKREYVNKYKLSAGLYHLSIPTTVTR